METRVGTKQSTDVNTRLVLPCCIPSDNSLNKKRTRRFRLFNFGTLK